jgi:acyl carrier protein
MYDELSRPTVRERLLSLCQGPFDLVDEDTPFNRTCNDDLDFVELVMKCEKEFNITINEEDKDVESFDTVKDFIDWVSSLIK